MPVSVKQFGEAVVGSGLLSADEFREIFDSLGGGVALADGAAIAEALVRQGKLTKFQSRQLQSRQGVPLVLGQYVVLEKIGAGGMGQVYKARHRRMNRIVALKLLPPGAADDPDVVRRFHREVQAAAKLSHANIVQAYDADEHDGLHYFAMEFVDGPDLWRVVKSRGALPIAEAVDYTIQAARGLAYAHAKGVVHRDIKPGNLLVDSTCTLKILDMGLARLSTCAEALESQLTESGQAMGTVDYMAPEQSVDARRADARSDIYSLGCTLYRLLTNTSAFDGATAFEKIAAHRTAQVPAARAKRSEVSEELDAVCRRMMAKRPEDRFQSAGELAEALVRCLPCDGNATASDQRVASMPPKISVPEIALQETATYIGHDSNTDRFTVEAVPSPTPRQTPSRSWKSSPAFVGGCVVAAAAAIAAWTMLRDPPTDNRAADELHGSQATTVGESNSMSDLEKTGKLIEVLSRSDPREAVRVAAALVERCRQTSGDDHPETAAALVHLGSAQQAQGDHAAARAQFEQALRIRRNSGGALSAETAVTLEKTAAVCVLLGDVIIAKTHYEQALQIRRQTLGADDPATRATEERLREVNEKLKTRNDKSE